MRVAGLLGLHNVGEGVMRAPGQVEIAHGLVIGTGHNGLDLAAGQRVMWRVSSHAMLISADGMHTGVVDAVELRRGERYVRVNIAGVRFDIASEDARLREGTPCRIEIRASGVALWQASSPH
jgi:molybdate transport system permease protein